MSFLEKKLELLKRLSAEQSYSSYTSLVAHLETNADQEILPNYNISILRNITFEPLIPVLEGEVALLGMQPDIYLGDFDSIALDIFDAQSNYFLHNSDVTILFQWLDGIAPALVEKSVSLSENQVTEMINNVVTKIKTQITAIRVHNKNPIIINNFPLIHRPTLGILDIQSDKSQSSIYNRLNQAILALTKEEQDLLLFDLVSLYSRIGTLSAFDERHWAMAKTPFSKASLVPAGQELGRFIRALTGNVRKCIVLDCDNTLWGGLIGEEGIEGIKLDQSYPGNSFVALQKEIVNLYHRGIIITLCSKNNEEEVLEVFKKHPGMVLKEEHIAAHGINWTDKAENILSLSQELNIGLESFVFLDDSDFECERVKEALPEVKVVNMKGPASSFKTLLNEQGLFDSLSFSSEEVKRTKTYQSNRLRAEMQRNTTSLEEYLSSLEIVVCINKVGKQETPRVSQLTQKTNQFNLTTKRYTLAQVKDFSQSTQSDVFYLSFKDKFADFGIVGAAIVLYENDYAKIDSFILSCRALGRGLEKALLISLVNYAKEKKCNKIIGLYEPTKKNIQVKNFYHTNGFQRSTKTETEYILDLELSKRKVLRLPKWITILKQGIK